MKISKLKEVKIFFELEIELLVRSFRQISDTPESKEKIDRLKFLIADYAIAKDEVSRLIADIVLIQHLSAELLELDVDSDDMGRWNNIIFAFNELKIIIKSDLIKDLWFTAGESERKYNLDKHETDKKPLKKIVSSQSRFLIRNFEEDFLFNNLYSDIHKAIEIAENMGKSNSSLAQILSLLSMYND